MALAPAAASRMGPHPVIAVAQALGDVLQGDLRSALEIGDGPGHLHHPVRPPRAEVEGLIGLVELGQ